MHEIVGFLKSIVQRDAAAGAYGCYLVRNGAIYAGNRNTGMQAGIAMDMAAEFNIPATALDAALARMKTVESLTIEGDEIVIKAGRMRSRIRCNGDPTLGQPDFPEHWQACPAGLVPALKLGEPFLGERAWQTAIRLMTGRVTAFSAPCGIDISVPDLKMDAPILITRETANFLVDQGAPDEMAIEKNAILFRWGDGRWLRAQLLNDAMPDQVETLLKLCIDQHPVDLTPDWVSAWKDAAALSDGRVTIRPTGFHATKDHATVDVDYPMPLPDDHASQWTVAVLNRVVDCATAWDPLTFPEPCSFTGPNFRGLVVGIR